jgi:hypothetical protein
MNIIWIRKSISEWISINIDEIKSFSYQIKGKSEFQIKYLYINNQIVARDDELILFKALEEFMKGGKGSKYPLQDNIRLYNKSMTKFPHR